MYYRGSGTACFAALLGDCRRWNFHARLVVGTHVHVVCILERPPFSRSRQPPWEFPLYPFLPSLIFSPFLLFHSISIFLFSSSFFFFSGINFEILRGWNINQCESTRSRNSLQSGRRIDRFWRVVYRIRGWNTRRCVYTHTRNLDGIRNRLREPLKMPSRWRWMAPRVANIYPVQSSLVHSWREYKEMASNGLKSDIQIATIPENDSMELEIFSILVSFSIFVLRSFFSSSFLVSFSLSTLLLRWFDEFEIYIMMSFS